MSGWRIRCHGRHGPSLRTTAAPRKVACRRAAAPRTKVHGPGCRRPRRQKAPTARRALPWRSPNFGLPDPRPMQHAHA